MASVAGTVDPPPLLPQTSLDCLTCPVCCTVHLSISSSNNLSGEVLMLPHGANPDHSAFEVMTQAQYDVSSDSNVRNLLCPNFHLMKMV